MASADVRDVATSRNPLLKVSSESKPNTVAGAICNVVRENARNNPPSVMATGPAAINQAMKAIAIARKYLLDEDTPIDLLVFPKFEQARHRQGWVRVRVRVRVGVGARARVRLCARLNQGCVGTPARKVRQLAPPTPRIPSLRYGRSPPTGHP